MTRERTYSDEEKARAVLAHCGRPIGDLVVFSPAELTELAAAYDRCRERQGGWQEEYERFAAARRQRLEEQKAADDEPSVGTIAGDKKKEKRSGGARE